MHKRTALRIWVLALAGVIAWAQEGHPLTGSWHGEWHPSEGHKVPIFLYMKWNSKSIDATLSPGPKAVPIKADLDPSNWTVHFDAETKDHKHVTAEGKLENIGSYNRTITGTWTEGAVKGDFKLTRD